MSSRAAVFPHSKLARLSHWIDQRHWLWLLLAAPFLLQPVPLSTPAMLALPIVWGAAALAGRPALPRTPLNVPLLGLGVMFLLSLGTTFSLQLSLSKIAALLLGYGLYFCVVRLVHNSVAAWRAGLTLCLLGAGLAVVGVATVDWLDKVPVLHVLTSRIPAIIRGLPGAEAGISPNAVAGTLILIFPMQVMIVGRRLLTHAALPLADPLARWPRLWLAVHLVLLALVGGILLISQSRVAWMGLAVGLLVLAAWHGPRLRRRLAIAIVSGLVLGLVLWATGILPVLLNQFMGSDLGPKLVQRQRLWQLGLLALRDFPLTGMGLNVFRVALPVLYSAYDVPRDFDFSHAHNQFLQTGIDLGVAGLIGYLALWLGIGWALVTAAGRVTDPWLRALIRGLSAGFVAHFIFGLGDAISLGAKLGVFFWGAAALAIGFYQATEQ